jgi:hypothetical protein
MQDEAEISERRIQPHLDIDPQQLLLTSLKRLQLDAKVLIIILEANAMLIGGHQVVFEECFQNTNEGQMVSRLSDKIGHHFWLQGLLNHVGGEQRASYMAAILCEILEFLHVYHMVAEVGFICYFIYLFIYFSSYVCDLL